MSRPKDPTIDGGCAPGQELRLLADAYQNVQALRIENGERIRALLQGRAANGAAETDDVDRVLREIREGASPGPIPALGRLYRQFYVEESDLAAAIGQAVRPHPAWPWLAEVRGIGPLLAGRLLARLDIRRADYPSSFWAYCGLATMPGVEYTCAECGLVYAAPVGAEVEEEHTRKDKKGECAGRLQPSRAAGEGVRVAQRGVSRGAWNRFDRTAKQLCYLIAVSFNRSGGAYREYYKRERARLDRRRPGWREARKHLSALRKTEKLFLRHLWLVWREAEQLPITTERQGERDRFTDPWAMVHTPAAKVGA